MTTTDAVDDFLGPDADSATTDDHAAAVAAAARRHQRAEQARGLRELAGVIEGLDDSDCLPPVFLWATATLWGDNASVERAAAVAKALKPCDKNAATSYFRIRRQFAGGVSLDVSFERDKVCTRRVIGTTEVTEEQVDNEAIVEAMGEVPKRFVTSTVERVEWDCPSLLRGDSGA